MNNRPSNRHQRRMLLGIAGVVALLGVAAALLFGGITAVRLALSTANATATSVPFFPTVIYFQPTPAAALPASPAAAPVQAATPVQVKAPVASGLGSVPGLDAFYCPQPKDVRATAIPATRFGYGIKSNWSVGKFQDWNETVAAKLRLTWIGIKINWYEFEGARGQPDVGKFKLLDDFVADARWRGLNIAVTITQPPKWSRSVNDAAGVRPSPPDQPAETVRFASLLASRYKGCLGAMEIFNEVNLERDWKTPANRISAADYLQHLIPTAAAVKAIDPAITLVMAAPSPTGANVPGGAQDDFEWLDAFVKADGVRHVDCIGVHLNGFNFPPDKDWNSGYKDPTAGFSGPFTNPHHSWSFLSTMKGYRERTNKPLCVTEFGWPSMDGLGVQGAPEGFGFALDNSAKEQADWIVQGFNIMRDLGYVKFGVVFNLDYIAKTTNSPAVDNALPYSLVKKDSTAREAFDAISRMPKP